MNDDSPPASAPAWTATAGQDRCRTLDASEAFEVLADERGRFVLYLLRDRGGTVFLDELVERLTEWERETAAERVTPDLAEGLYVRLHHVTLPRLDDAGLVTYDAVDGTVTAERDVDVEKYLAFTRRREADAVERFLDRTRRNVD